MLSKSKQINSFHSNLLNARSNTEVYSGLCQMSKMEQIAEILAKHSILDVAGFWTQPYCMRKKNKLKVLIKYVTSNRAWY